MGSIEKFYFPGAKCVPNTTILTRLGSAQAADRGIRGKRNSADLATIGESVVRVFFKRRIALPTEVAAADSPDK
jgi:hypothetical protein